MSGVSQTCYSIVKPTINLVVRLLLLDTYCCVFSLGKWHLPLSTGTKPYHLRVLIVSWYASATGDIAASMTVLELPPMLSLRSHVSIEFLVAEQRMVAADQ